MSAGSHRKGLVWEVAALAARWGVGLLFIYMGMNKAMHPFDFLKLVREYDLVQSHILLNPIAAALPWFEVYCGLLLVLGVAVRGSALLVLAMLVPFTLVVLKRALTIADAQSLAFCAVKFDCGCGNGEVFICRKLAENGLLMILSAWLLVSRHGRRWALRFNILANGDEGAGADRGRLSISEAIHEGSRAPEVPPPAPD